MTTYSYTVGSGGNFANAGLWQTNRLGDRNGDPALLPGDVEEAVMLDGTYIGGLAVSTDWPSGVTIRVRAQNPHLGDWTVASQGARIESDPYGQAFRAYGDYAADTWLELVDLVGSAHASAAGRHWLNMEATGLKFRLVRTMATGTTAIGGYAIKCADWWPNTALELENCVITTAHPTEAAIHLNWNSGQVCPVTARGSVIHSIYAGKASSQNSALDIGGCILLKAPSPNGSARVAVDSTCPDGWTDWTTTNCLPAAVVTGTPAAGQVGVVDLATYNYALVHHANNVAIGLAVNTTMPSVDILGVARDGTPDAGAFEAVAPPTEPPDAPSGVEIEALTITSLRVSWSDNSDNESGFELRYRLAGEVSWVTAPTTAPNATAVTLTGLATGEYEAQVRAVNVVGESDWTTTATGATRPLIAAQAKACGINMERPYYYTPEPPFKDLMRTCGNWGDQYSDGSTANPTPDLDSLGNPLSITGDRLRLAIRDVDGAFEDLDQVWVLLWDGVMTATVNNSTILSSVPGRIEFKMHHGLCLLDVYALGSPTPTNIRCVRDSDEATYLAEPLRGDFLSMWSGVQCVRYLNWSRTGALETGDATWAARPLPGRLAPKWGELPLEYIVEHSNAIGTDAWVIIPHIASDDYVTQMAILLRDGLTEGQRIYVEYSNECWNYAFPQATYCLDRGQDSTDPVVQSYASQPYVANAVWYGMRVKQVMDLFSAVFAGQMHRIVRVVGFQSVGTWGANVFLYPGLYDAVDAIAIAPYVNNSSSVVTGSEDNATIIAGLTDLIDTSMRPSVQTYKPHYRDTYGLRVIGYEGGQHMYPPGNADGPINDKLASINRDPLMEQFVVDYMTAWHEETDDLMCWYKSTSRYDRFGYWGLRESYAQTSTPKLDGFLGYMASVAGAPAAPTSFVAGPATATTAAVSWTDNATDETVYTVEYSLEGDESWILFADDLAANSTGVTITGLVASTTYDVRVRATNSYGASTWLVGQVTTQAGSDPVGGSLRRRRGMSLGLGLGF